MRSYRQIHWDLRAARGKADEYPCVACGKPAKDWAYQNNGNPELYDQESGRPYCEDLTLYEPMCRNCHFKMDATDLSRKLGQLLGRSNSIRAQHDEEFAAKLSADRAAAARVVNAKRRQCLDCGRVAHPAAIGAHLKGSGHSGYRELDPTNSQQP